MSALTVSKEDEKRVKGMGFLNNRGTDLFSERIVTINGKVEVLYNVVEFYCLEGLVIVKLPDNSIKYVGDESTMDNLKCIHFNSWEKALDGE